MPNDSRPARRRAVFPLGLLLIELLFFLSGSTGAFADSADTLSTRTLADIVIALDNAMTALGKPAADYRKILQHTLVSLPRDSPASLTLAITNLLKRAPAVGPDFRCSPDFLGYVGRNQLLQLKDALLGVSPRPSEPHICYVAPYAVDVTRPTDTVEIYGYDLDQVPVEMFLVDTGGFHDVTSALRMRTHYHLTLSLGDHGVQFSPGSQALGVTWGHLIHHSIALIQPGTPLCESRIEEIPAEKALTYAAPRIRGERPLAGAGLSVRAAVTLDYESNKVDAITCITATQPGDRPVLFSGCGSEYVYTSEPERVVERVLGALESDVTYVDRRRGEVVKEGAHGGPVRRWTFRGFGGRLPAGAAAQVTARLAKLRVVSTAVDGCVSAIAYAEAKRAHRLSRRTTARLDRELRRAGPEISQLRPRFAPPGY